MPPTFTGTASGTTNSIGKHPPPENYQGGTTMTGGRLAQCREMCQLCDGNVSQAALQWTEASATGVMTPAREE
jgi:hypothetical protein